MVRARTYRLVYSFARFQSDSLQEASDAILPSKIDKHFAAENHQMNKKARECIIQEVAKVNMI